MEKTKITLTLTAELLELLPNLILACTPISSALWISSIKSGLCRIIDPKSKGPSEVILKDSSVTTSGTDKPTRSVPCLLPRPRPPRTADKPPPPPPPPTGNRDVEGGTMGLWIAEGRKFRFPLPPPLLPPPVRPLTFPIIRYQRQRPHARQRGRKIGNSR